MSKAQEKFDYSVHHPFNRQQWHYHSICIFYCF